MPTVHVNLGPRSYDIEIGSGNLRNAAKLCDAEQDDAHTVIITDSNVAELYNDALVETLEELGCEVAWLEVEPGEPSKAPEVATELWEELLDHGADRKTVIVALGGGVVGDLAGFVAATFGRGLRFVQIPTTLLAQVDSSVGGKVGVNLPGGKNMVGAFWQPKGVLIDVDVLQSLPEREYHAGLAEVVKYGVIQDADFFAYLEANVGQINTRDAAVLTRIVERCCRLKADVVEQDEREETGLRSILNYGHTYCHAFEAATGYEKLLHGEGVAIGMMCAARWAERLGRIDAKFVERQQKLLAALALPMDVPDVDHNELVELMYRDKKAERGKLRFVLPTRMGHVELVGDVTNDDVLASIAR
ncbi:MAG TPA: 3-dehydroquinate synthase [Lacipirellulaceae bacterium]|nr:3-dehydroquinate synthase [Lacipirellulaceae bacterium]